MKPTFARILAYVARLLRRFNRRIPALENVMDCTLTAIEAAAVARACSHAGVRFGAFYAWKAEQMALIAALRGLGKDRILALIRRNDHTDYAYADAAMADPRGLLIALPHHGHFVSSIVALCDRLRHQREIFVFYDPPRVHASNKIFDVLHECLFSDDAIRVTILHNNRAGIVRAMRELRAGQVVVIMPDAYRNVDDTYQVPFCGAQRNTMLGTATIARRTGAHVLPTVSRPGPGLFEFTTAFGLLLDPCVGTGLTGSELHADFRTTMALFSRFEPLMSGQLHYWQYAPGHVASHQGTPTPQAILTTAPALLQDPRITVNLQFPILLDTN